ncbi:MAG: TlpA disulfide reductase family protein [Lachnospiraceae bacterium]
MKSQMKKLFATLITVSVVVSLLSGCGGSNGSGGSGGSAGDQQAPAQTAAQGAGGSSKDEGAPPTVSDAENTYIILVQDADDASPISGAVVQFCSSTQCMVGRTDATGAASFESDPGSYTAHVLKVPEGYEVTGEEIALSADNRTAVFAIRKAGAAKESGSEADTAPSNGKNAKAWDLPLAGFSFTVPESFRSCKGQLYYADRGETDYGSEIFSADIIYLARTDEEKAAFEEKTAGATELTPELQALTDAYYDNRNPDLVFFVCAGKEIDSQKITDTVLYGLPAREFTQVGESDKYNFYFIVPDYTGYEDFLRENLGDELYEEFDALLKNAGSLKAQVSVKDPVRPVTAAGTGEQFVFETTDLDGKAVSSADLFAGHKVTMINIWATWCDPCKNELPELEEFAKELAGKDCQIIGICEDTSYDDTAAAEAKEILAKAGVTYTNIKATDEMLEMMTCLAMPTSYFVDSEGHVLTMPVRGADFEKYRERIEEALKLAGE